MIDHLEHVGRGTVREAVGPDEVPDTVPAYRQGRLGEGLPPFRS